MKWQLLEGILRYMSTNESCLNYKYACRTMAESTVTALSDFSFGDDASNKNSNIGNLIIWNNYIIDWDLGTTKNVVPSTCEAEFVIQLSFLQL